jgi:E3 ubiquitin-protein ligase RNF19A
MRKKVNRLFSKINPHFGKCTTCEFEICMKCGLDYHSNKSCKEVLDSALKEYFKGLDPGSLTNCPRCGLIVEKEEGGCNHMICIKCKYEFCWICGSKYNVEHFAPGNVFGC